MSAQAKPFTAEYLTFGLHPKECHCGVRLNPKRKRQIFCSECESAFDTSLEAVVQKVPYGRTPLRTPEYEGFGNDVGGEGWR